MAVNRKREKQFLSAKDLRKFFVDPTKQNDERRTPIHVFEERFSQARDIWTGEPLTGWEMDSWLALYHGGKDLEPEFSIEGDLSDE